MTSEEGPIYFYSRTVEHYELSNFSPHGFEEGGAYWPIGKRSARR